MGKRPHDSSSNGDDDSELDAIALSLLSFFGLLFNPFLALAIFNACAFCCACNLTKSTSESSSEELNIASSESPSDEVELKMMQRSFYLQLQKEIANPSAMIHLSLLLLKKKKTTTTTKKQAKEEMVMMMKMTTTTTKMIHF